MNFFIKRPLVCVAFTFLSCLALSCTVDDDNRVGFLLVTIPSIVFLTALYVLLTKLSKRHPQLNNILIFCAAISVIALILPLFMFNFKNKDFAKYSGTTARIEATVSAISSETSSYASFSADVTRINGEDADFSIQIFTEFSPQLSVGDIFICDANLTSAEQSLYYSKFHLKHKNLLFDATCEESAYFEKVGHKDTLFTFFDGINREIGFKCDRLFSKSTSALAKALLLGDKDNMPGIMERDFGRIGISHLLALSGMHLALFTAMIMGIFKYFIPNSKARFVATIIIAIFIMLLTGASPSITRAALMVIYYQIGNLLRKQHDLITTLFAVTLTIVLFDPYMIFDVGLILSFTATFGIALLSSPINRLSLYLFKNPLKLSIPEKILKFAVESVCISFAAGMLVNVAVILIFERMSLLTMLTTMIFTPLIVCFIVVAALALILSALPYVSAFLLSLSELLGDTIINTADYFSSLKDITVSTHHSLMYVFIAVFLVGFAYIVARNKTATSLIIFTVVLQLVISLFLILQIKVFNRDATLTQVSIGDSEGFIITNIDETAIIDNSYAVSAYRTLCSSTLAELKATEIDKLILTHYHQRHISFIKGLSKLYIIRTLYIPAPIGDTDTSYALDIAEAADNLGIKLEYYSPYAPINTVNGVHFVALPYARSGKSDHPKLAFTLESSEYVLLYSAGYSFDEDKLSDVDFFLSGVHGKTADIVVKAVEVIPPGAPVRTLLKYAHP